MSYTISEKCNGCGACKRICPAKAISGSGETAHAILAGACIECGACGRICPRSAVLDQWLATCLMEKRSDWPIPHISLKPCMACAACVEACPAGCLAMSGSIGSHTPATHPYLKDEKACIGCGFCSRECPVDAITMQQRKEAREA